MNFEEAKQIVAKKHGLGKKLVTGHLSKYWEEAAELYARSKWDEACEAQMQQVWKQVDYSGSVIAGDRFHIAKPEFKP